MASHDTTTRALLSHRFMQLCYAKNVPCTNEGILESCGFWCSEQKGLLTSLDSSLDSGSFRSGRDVSSHPGRPELTEEPKWQPEKLLFLPRCFLHLDVSPKICSDIAN